MEQRNPGNVPYALLAIEITTRYGKTRHLQMNLRIEAKLSLFDENSLAKIADSARRLAADLSFRIQGTTEFMDLLRDFGCKVSGERVKLTKNVVDTVFDRMDAVKAGASKVPPPSENDPGVSIFTHGQAIHVCDATTNRLRAEDRSSSGQCQLWAPRHRLP